MQYLNRMRGRHYSCIRETLWVVCTDSWVFQNAACICSQVFSGSVLIKRNGIYGMSKQYIQLCFRQLSQTGWNIRPKNSPQVCAVLKCSRWFRQPPTYSINQFTETLIDHAVNHTIADMYHVFCTKLWTDYDTVQWRTAVYCFQNIEIPFAKIFIP